MHSSDERSCLEFVPVEHRMLGFILAVEACARPEFRMGDQLALVLCLVLQEMGFGNVEYGQGHTTADVYAYAIGKDRIPGSQHTADRQSVALVGIGHQGSGDCHRQL